MRHAIETFWDQFSFTPEVVNEETLRGKPYRQVVLCGMGGSHLAADLAQTAGLPIFVHSDYGLPNLPPSILDTSLFIMDSYSGNTEEVLDAFDTARSANYPVACITTGGKLLAKAKEHELPYIVLPKTGIQPRAGLGYQLLALMRLIEHKGALQELQQLAVKDMSSFQSIGKKLADILEHTTPLIYSSEKNRGLAYYFKITLNETGKIPAFYNVLPEMNHNEFTGFDTGPQFQGPHWYTAVFLYDDDDHPRIKRRLTLTEQILSRKGLETEILHLTPETPLTKGVSLCVIAMWCAWYVAGKTHADPEQVPLIESFKEQL